MKGEYNIKAIPINDKSWREAEKVEVSLKIEVDGEYKIFKGLLDLTGIIKK